MMLSLFIAKSSEVMVVPRGGMRRSRAIKPRGNKRRRDAVQTRVRGGCSGGGWPRPSGRESFRWSSNPVRNDGKRMEDGHRHAREAFRHAGGHEHAFARSQPALAPSTDSTACRLPSRRSWPTATCHPQLHRHRDVAAITGRDNGANARPAITSTASIWRMTKTTFTTLSSHKLAAKGSALLTVQEAAVLIGIKLPASIWPHGFVRAVVPIPADRDRAARNRRNPPILPSAVRVATGW